MFTIVFFTVFNVIVIIDRVWHEEPREYHVASDKSSKNNVAPKVIERRIDPSAQNWPYEETGASSHLTIAQIFLSILNECTSYDRETTSLDCDVSSSLYEAKNDREIKICHWVSLQEV